MRRRNHNRFSTRRRVDLDRRVEEFFEASGEARYQAWVDVLLDFAATASQWPQE